MIPQGTHSRRRVFRSSTFQDLPHLQNVFRPSQRTTSNITDIEYSTGWEYPLSVTHLTIDASSTTRESDRFFASLRDPHDVVCGARLLIVEDISTPLIDRLVRILGISPEMFEEHIFGADWNQSNEAESKAPEDNPSTWQTKRLQRDYVSIAWPRPLRVESRLWDEIDIVDRNVILFKAGTTEFEDDQLFEYEVKTNIWRRHMDMRDSLLTGNDQRTTRGLVSGDFIASEERVTLWKGVVDGVDFVLLLVDHGLMGALKSDSRTHRQKESQTFWQVRETGLKKDRSTLDVPPRPVRRDSFRKQSITRAPTEKPINTGVALDHSAKNGLKASRRDSQEEASATLPDPSSSSTQRTPAVYVDRASVMPQILRRFGISWSTDSQNKNYLLVDVTQDDVDRLIRDTARTFELRTSDNPATNNLPFINVASRTPLAVTNLANARANKWLLKSTDTREDLIAWLRTSFGQKSMTVGPVLHIFSIIRNDVLDLIALTDDWIDRILSQSSDEVRIEQQLNRWRTTILSMDVEYRQLEQAFVVVPRFLEKGDRYHSTAPVYKTWSPSTTMEQQKLSEEIKMIRDRLAYALQALVSAISVVESKRGIAEAESVTRLTELAFLFIPLSFAASFFGMQVMELPPETTSIKWFVVTAIAATASSYGVRLLIRSRWFLYLKERMVTAIRQYAGIDLGEPIPSSVFLRWLVVSPFRAAASTKLGHQLRPIMPYTLLCIVGGFVPLFSVWLNHSLRSGIKVVVSIAIVLSIVLLLSATAGRKLVRIMKLYLAEQRKKRQVKRLRQGQRQNHIFGHGPDQT